MRQGHARAVLASSLFAVAVGARADLPASAQFKFGEPPQLESAEQLDTAIDLLVRANWEAYVEVNHSDPDQREAERNLQQLLLTPARLARLRQLSSQAKAQSGGGAALQAALSEARPLLAQESYRWAMVQWRVVLDGIIATHEERVRRLENLLPPAGRLNQRKFITDVLTNFNSGFETAMAADSTEARNASVEQLSASFQGVINVYNAARGTLATAVSRQEHAQGKDNSIKSREAPCPERAVRTSGGEHPGIASDNVAPESFYPVESRRVQFEGLVTVQVWVSATGCEEKAQVYDSSGVDELDDAAIRWTEQAKFLPAESDHKPIDATMRFRMKFKLSE